jgi:hypothetical protein
MVANWLQIILDRTRGVWQLFMQPESVAPASRIRLSNGIAAPAQLNLCPENLIAVRIVGAQQGPQLVRPQRLNLHLGHERFPFLW